MKRLSSLVALSIFLSTFANLSGAYGQGCTFENRGYFEGQVVCQAGSEMRCTADGWAQTGNPCSGADESEEVQQPEAEAPPEVEMPEEPQVPEVEVPPVTE